MDLTRDCPGAREGQARGVHFFRSRTFRMVALPLALVATAAAGWVALHGLGKVLLETTAGLSPTTPALAEEKSAAAQNKSERPQGDRSARQKRLPPDPFPRKIPAPPLTGGSEWLNTAGPITMESLRGKVVLLDFWTYCCINCMHVLSDLEKLEQKYANQLVVIGVHSAKFDAERDSQNILEAILRYEISHPVVNDADMIIWRRFGVRAWPTLWMIDPEGNAVGYVSGEWVYEDVNRAIVELVNYHRAKGTLKETPVRFALERENVAETPLRFPGKVLADAASNRLFISDSNHNRIVIATLSGVLVDTIGTGSIGREDGPFEQATFFRPQGMALVGDQLYVADTENHLIRMADLKARTVSTVAGTAEQGHSRSHQAMPALQTGLNSPWDLCWHDGKLYIAMAGPHQIWRLSPKAGTVQAYAGSGREDIVDGKLRIAAMAQPSGLTSDGGWLYVADSEGSSIRAVPLDPDKEVHTVVGTSRLPDARLFTFGDADGDHGEARLQHPLGVAWSDGMLYVADTYNNKIKIVDPRLHNARTFLGDGEPGKQDDPPRFDEPGGLSVAEGKLYIADTNNHSIRVADLKTGKVQTLPLQGITTPRLKPASSEPIFPNARNVKVPAEKLQVSAGDGLVLQVQIRLRPGFKLNELAPMTYLVESLEHKGLVRGELLGQPQRLDEPNMRLDIPLATSRLEGKETIRVSLTYFPCRADASGLCEVKSVIWELPLRITAKAKKKTIELLVNESTSQIRADE